MGISLSYFNTPIVKIILFFFLTTASQANTNNVQEQTREACQQLIDEAWEETNNKNYVEALEKLLKAELMAERHQWNDKLWLIKNHIGMLYNYISNFGEALEYYQESFAITENNSELYEKGASPLANIGLLHLKEKKYEEALHYYTRAYDIVKNTDAVTKKHIASIIANIYNQIGRTEKSFEILYETEEQIDDTRISFLWKAAYIGTLLEDGQVIKAKNLAEQLYTELEDGLYEDYRQVCQICIAELLSKIYMKLDEIDLAITYAKQGLNISDELAVHIELYKNISTLYSQKNEYQIALQYKDSVISATDSLSVLINRNLYEANKVKFKTQEYQNELKTEKERQKSQRKLFIAIIIFGLTIVFFIYRGLQNRVIKQKQKMIITSLALEKKRKEHLLAEKKLEMIKSTALLKQEQLKREIATKNRELTAKAIYHSNRNELIKDIINSLEKKNKVKDKELSGQVRAIKNILHKDIDRDNFLQHFERVNPSFLKKLKEKHPQLTSNDTRFLCYIFMNLSLKEISSIFNISYNACKKRKKRIMDKIGLDKENDFLYDYILEITS